MLQYKTDPSKPTIPWPTWQRTYHYEPFTYWQRKGTTQAFLLIGIEHGPFTPKEKEVAIMIEWGKTLDKGVTVPLHEFDAAVKDGRLIKFTPKL